MAEARESGVPGGGRGLFVLGDVKEGATAVEEAPLAWLQHMQNRVEASVCEACAAFVGSEKFQLRHLRDGEQDTAEEEEEEDEDEGVVQCSHGCGEFYCNTSCRDAVQASHLALCTGGQPLEEESTNPLVQFVVHAVMHNETLLLAARTIVRAAHGGSDYIAQVDALESPLWWEASPAATEEDQAEMKHLVHESLALLRAAWGQEPLPPLHCDNDGAGAGGSSSAHVHDSVPTAEATIVPWISKLPPAMQDHVARYTTLEGFARLMGAFERNSISVELVSPLDVDGAPVLDGIGIFPRSMALANHSCTPNCQIEYESHSNTAHLVALRDVSAGEELFISYIDEDAPTEERQEALEDYGFACACPKCKQSQQE